MFQHVSPARQEPSVTLNSAPPAILAFTIHILKARIERVEVSTKVRAIAQLYFEDMVG